jgi:hypothetical protein
MEAVSTASIVVPELKVEEAVKGPPADNTASISFAASTLDRKDTFGSSDPYVVLNRVHPDGRRERKWQSEVVQKSLNPVWSPAHLYVPLVVDNDVDAPVVAEVYDWNKGGKHTLIGETAPTTLRKLMVSCKDGIGRFPLVNPSKSKKKGYTNSGVLEVRASAVYPAPSALAYVETGTRVRGLMAVDFTEANAPGVSRKEGLASSPASLHYLGDASSSSAGSLPNAYAAALWSLTAWLQKLSGGLPVEAFGFGATSVTVPGSKRPAACASLFPLSSPSNGAGSASCADPASVLSAYRSAASSVQAGPSSKRSFVPALKAALDAIAAEGELTFENQHYTVVSLLTCAPMADVGADVEMLLKLISEEL